MYSLSTVFPDVKLSVLSSIFRWRFPRSWSVPPCYCSGGLWVCSGNFSSRWESSQCLHLSECFWLICSSPFPTCLGQSSPCSMSWKPPMKKRLTPSGLAAGRLSDLSSCPRYAAACFLARFLPLHIRWENLGPPSWSVVTCACGPRRLHSISSPSSRPAISRLPTLWQRYWLRFPSHSFLSCCVSRNDAVRGWPDVHCVD